jgi:CheY-like chemotaxis protein
MQCDRPIGGWMLKAGRCSPFGKMGECRSERDGPQRSQLVCTPQPRRRRLHAARGAAALMLSLSRAAPQRILVVDDDVAIHRVVEKVFSVSRVAAEGEQEDRDAPPSSRAYALGFASNGQDALTLAERAQRQGTPFKVALVDMRMPGWDGIETVSRLYRIEPQLQVALCSAYMDYSWQEVLERLQRPGLRQLRKPWTSGQILALVHELCQRAQMGTGGLSAYPHPARPKTGR